MLIASLFVSIAFGFLLAFCFSFYYVIGDVKWKIFIEALIGIGGNTGLIFLLDKVFKYTDEQQDIRMFSMGSIVLAFLVGVAVLLVIFSHLIKDKDDKDILRIRDILLDQREWVNKYYSNRMQQIDNGLNIEELSKREEVIIKRESELNEREQYLEEETKKFYSDSRKQTRMVLPDQKRIIINNEYVDLMPSYLSDVIRCMISVDSFTEEILKMNPTEITSTTIKTFFTHVATHVSIEIFGNTRDVRIHFRYYDPSVNGYVKLIAVTAGVIVSKNMTVIPYDKDSLIKRSYECKRALIKSVNSEHEFQSDHNTIWKDYLSYTFYDICKDEKPVFSFGISIKNVARYKKVLQLLNYFKLEEYLQRSLDRINQYVDIVKIFYGDDTDERSA